MSQSLIAKGKKKARSARAASSTSPRPGPSRKVPVPSASSPVVPVEEEDDPQDDMEDKSEALARLQALGNDFMASFGPAAGTSSAPSSSTLSKKQPKKRRKLAEEEIEEEAGDEIDVLLGSTAKRALKMKAKAPSKPRRFEPEMVVFDGSAGSTSTFAQGSVDRTSFMSSKTSRLTGDGSNTTDRSGKRKASADGDSEDEGEEKQNASNDRLLSQLLSTTLFSPGSTIGREDKKRDLSSSATIARIMELTTPESKRAGGAIGRGWGEMALKKAQNGRIPTKIQVGLDRARKEKEQQEIEREKELGIYNPHLKRGEVSMGKGAKKQRRERGIGMGVGKFKDGALRLEKADIDKVIAKSKKGYGKGKGKRR